MEKFTKDEKAILLEIINTSAIPGKLVETIVSLKKKVGELETE